jgi:hypothetical protein
MAEIYRIFFPPARQKIPGMTVQIRGLHRSIFKGEQLGLIIVLVYRE